MTHPTDEELDALMQRMSKLADDMEKHATYDWDEHEDVRATLNAITTLRAQLAEARAALDNANKIMDDWTTLHRVIADIRDASGIGSRLMLSELAHEIGKRIAAALARADRAEAERAAQIEADAGLLQAVADNWNCGCDIRYCRCAEKAEQWDLAADEIRAQSHDRTALDRMLAEAEARGYQLAADEAKRSGWHLRRYDLAKRDAELAKP